MDHCSTTNVELETLVAKVKTVNLSYITICCGFNIKHEHPLLLAQVRFSSKYRLCKKFERVTAPENGSRDYSEPETGGYDLSRPIKLNNV